MSHKRAERGDERYSPLEAGQGTEARQPHPDSLRPPEIRQNLVLVWENGYHMHKVASVPQIGLVGR